MSWRVNQSFGGRLVRPHEGRMVAGVCAGIALHYGWDVALVRIVALLSILCTGLPVVAYMVAWICIPNAPYLLPPSVPSAPYPAGTMGQ